MEKSKNVCQSCGMPLEKAEHLGSNADGSVCKDYCVYCYKDGKFTNPNISMQGMIDYCVQYLTTKEKMNKEDAQKYMGDTIPKLKRWKGKSSSSCCCKSKCCGR